MGRGRAGGSGSGGSGMEEAAEGRVLLALPGVSLPLSLPPRLLRGRLRILQGPQDLELHWEPLEEPWEFQEDSDPPDPGFEPDWAVLSSPRARHGWSGGFRLGLRELRGLRRGPPGLGPPLLVLLPRGGAPAPPPLHLPRGGLRKILRTLGGHLRTCPGDPRLLLLATPEDPPEPPPSPGLVTRWLQGPRAALGGLGRLWGAPRGGEGPDPEPPFELLSCVRLGPRPSPPRGPPVSRAEWGRGLDPEVLLERIFRGGLSPELRPQGWRLLLGLRGWGDPEETPKTTGGTPKTTGGTPKIPEGTPKTTGETPETPGETPKTSEETPKTAEGTPKTPGGTPETPEGTPKTTGETPKTSEETPKTAEGTPKIPEGTSKTPEGTPKICRGIPRRPEGIPETEQARRDDYFRMKLQWRSLSPGQLRRNKILRGYQEQMERDLAGAPPWVPRSLLRDVLMTFCMFHFDLGYRPGMLELLPPLAGVAPDEVETFWEFCGVMDAAGENFGPGPEGLRRSLGAVGALLRELNPALSPLLGRPRPRRCLSRWLQWRFQRPLGLRGTQRLWEVLWTGLPCPNFHLLVTCALLELLGDTWGQPGDTWGQPGDSPGDPGDSPGDLGDSPGDSDSDRDTAQGDTDSEDSDDDKVSPGALQVGEVLSRAEGMFLQLATATGLPPALQELLGLGEPPEPPTTPP